VSLSNKQQAADSGYSRMNIASAYRYVSLGVVRLHVAQGIDTTVWRDRLAALIQTIASSKT